MTLEEIKATEEAKKVAEEAEPTPPSEENAEVDADENPIKPKESDVDFKKELEHLEAETPPKRSEKEKAEHTLKSIYGRFPDLKLAENEPDSEDDKLSAMEYRILRQHVEGIIRQNSKTDDEIKYKMFFYDNRIVKTGNIHEDADNAEWLANKARTRNALSEMKRKPESPGSPAGAGQRPPVSSAPEFSPEVRKRMEGMGLKEIVPGTWEGTKVGMKWNPKTKTFDDYIVGKK